MSLLPWNALPRIFSSRTYPQNRLSKLWSRLSPITKYCPSGTTSGPQVPRVGSVSVTATGDGVLTYQWQKNGSNLSNGGHYSGVTTATLTITRADPGDVAEYGCVVTGLCGSVTSAPAGLWWELSVQRPHR